MKRYLLVILVFVILIVGGTAIFVKPYYTPAVKLQGLTVNTHHDDTIRIGYIGDSWAEMHQSVKCVIDTLVSSNMKKPVIVRTAGFGGFTSKTIYNGIFRNKFLRDVIEWGPDFCFVIAGINDSDRKKGPDYYKENMKLIIETLLEHRITPVILEIPSYDINYSYSQKSAFVKLRCLPMMCLSWSKLDCINDYRTAYADMIKGNHWESKVITISSEEWNPNGYKDPRGLYVVDRMHLNEKGYLVLDSCISYHIINYLNDSGVATSY